MLGISCPYVCTVGDSEALSQCVVFLGRENQTSGEGLTGVGKVPHLCSQQ